MILLRAHPRSAVSLLSLHISDLLSRHSLSLALRSPSTTFHRPSSLSELASLRVALPHAKLVVGNTELGVDVRLRGVQYSHYISVTHVKELSHIEWKADGLSVGCSVSLQALYDSVSATLASSPEDRYRFF